MIETLFAMGIVTLAALGLGLGLLFGRGAPKSTCHAAACSGFGACETCPRRHAKEDSR